MLSDEETHSNSYAGRTGAVIGHDTNNKSDIFGDDCDEINLGNEEAPPSKLSLTTEEGDTAETSAVVHSIEEYDGPNRSAPISPEPIAYTFKVLIREFDKRGDGMNAYIVYKLETEATGVVDYTKQHFETWRRYSDFLVLHDKIVKNDLVKGRVIPIPPEKSITNSDPPIRQLELYIGWLIQHPKYRNICDVRDFLEIEKDSHTNSYADQTAHDDISLGSEETPADTNNNYKPIAYHFGSYSLLMLPEVDTVGLARVRFEILLLESKEATVARIDAVRSWWAAYEEAMGNLEGIRHHVRSASCDASWLEIVSEEADEDFPSGACFMTRYDRKKLCKLETMELILKKACQQSEDVTHGSLKREAEKGDDLVHVPSNHFDTKKMRFDGTGTTSLQKPSDQHPAKSPETMRNDCTEKSTMPLAELENTMNVDDAVLATFLQSIGPELPILSADDVDSFFMHCNQQQEIIDLTGEEIEDNTHVPKCQKALMSNLKFADENSSQKAIAQNGKIDKKTPKNEGVLHLRNRSIKIEELDRVLDMFLE